MKCWRRTELAAKAEFCNEFAVASDVAIADVVEHAATTTHQHQQATTAVVIFRVCLQVCGEVVDAVGEERNLHVG